MWKEVLGKKCIQFFISLKDKIIDLGYKLENNFNETVMINIACTIMTLIFILLIVFGFIYIFSIT